MQSYAIPHRPKQCTHMALEGGEVNVGNEKNRLGLKVRHHLEDGHVIAFLEDGHFDIDD